MVCKTSLRSHGCNKIYSAFSRHTYTDGSLAKKVVDIYSSNAVSVQGFNVEKFSADSYAILPLDVLGMVHYIMSYTLQSIQTQFAIVAKVSTLGLQVKVFTSKLKFLK